jgi:hypothetical protein
MAVIAFEYQIVPGEAYLLPICLPRLIGPRAQVTLRALVDSGATFVVFPESAAEDTGIKLPKYANACIGFGRTVVAGREVEVDLGLKERRWRAPVVFVERLEFKYALFGRRGVFDQFREVAFIENVPSPRVEFRY